MFTNTRFLSVFALAALLAVGFSFQTGSAFAMTSLSSQLDVGASSADVSNLQTLLATDASIYPEALVTGYFGSLTQAAVKRFQCREGIVCSGDAASTGYGRVGPSTLARLNTYVGNGSIASGGGGGGAPTMTAVSVSTSTAGSATLSWNSSRASFGKVYYQTSFPVMSEQTPTSPASVSGTVVQESALSTNHSITLSGLQSGQTYYYVAESVDANGNRMLTWPMTFAAR